MVVETVDDFWQGSGTYVACMSCVVGCWYAIPLKFGAVLTAMAFRRNSDLLDVHELGWLKFCNGWTIRS